MLFFKKNFYTKCEELKEEKIEIFGWDPIERKYIYPPGNVINNEIRKMTRSGNIKYDQKIHGDAYIQIDIEAAVVSTKYNFHFYLYWSVDGNNVEYAFDNKKLLLKEKGLHFFSCNREEKMWNLSKSHYLIVKQNNLNFFNLLLDEQNNFIANVKKAYEAKFKQDFNTTKKNENALNEFYNDKLTKIEEKYQNENDKKVEILNLEKNIDMIIENYSQKKIPIEILIYNQQNNIGINQNLDQNLNPGKNLDQNLGNFLDKENKEDKSKKRKRKFFYISGFLCILGIFIIVIVLKNKKIRKKE